MDGEELPTSGGIEPHRKPYNGQRLSAGQRGWRKPVTSPEMRAAIKADAAEIREEEPAISKSELARRLSLKHGIKAGTIINYL